MISSRLRPPTHDGGDLAGQSVSSAGDLNGDGFDDLIIGAYGGDGPDGTRPSAGEAIVVFGGDFLGTVVHAGTTGNDTLTGTAAAETFVGGQGDDTMIGNGGTDAFQGGEGDDLIELLTSLFAKIDGGSLSPQRTGHARRRRRHRHRLWRDRLPRP